MSNGKFPNYNILEEGQGLWRQLDSNYKKEYQHDGYLRFGHIMQQATLTALLEDMTDDFTPEEMIRMKEMIDSEDVENMGVVSAIIDAKLAVK